ncbi:MAG TPA: helix-turn-helix domain-containing protein, partial [candidate division Zixibacteria bacterium]|nr:helix-turn-helix domain-containing protein [candidate division Zixibacteria bacterium]
RASVESIRQVNRSYAERALADILASRMKNVSVETIQQAVSEAFGAPVSLLKSKKRTAHIALARQTAMYLIRTLTGRSLQQIGHDFGGRDHSTVIHGCSLIAEKIERDEDFKRLVDQIMENCR